ncbi:MAG: hypothetical protein AAF723_04330 [Pseudomonadota bacterium]
MAQKLGDSGHTPQGGSQRGGQGGPKGGYGHGPAAPRGARSTYSPGQHYPQRSGKYGQQMRPMASPELKASLTGNAASSSDALREAMLVVAIIHHPQLFWDHEDEILSLEIAHKDLAKLLGAVIDELTIMQDLDRQDLTTHMLSSPDVGTIYQEWLKHPLIRTVQFVHGEATYKEAETGWLNTLSIDRHQGDLEAEVAEAALDAHLDVGRERTWFDAVSHRARLLSDPTADDAATDHQGDDRLKNKRK